jgi:hypothetical protein
MAQQADDGDRALFVVVLWDWMFGRPAADATKGEQASPPLRHAGVSRLRLGPRAAGWRATWIALLGGAALSWASGRTRSAWTARAGPPWTYHADAGRRSSALPPALASSPSPRRPGLRRLADSARPILHGRTAASQPSRSLARRHCVCVMSWQAPGASPRRWWLRAAGALVQRPAAATEMSPNAGCPPARGRGSNSVVIGNMASGQAPVRSAGAAGVPPAVGLAALAGRGGRPGAAHPRRNRDYWGEANLAGHGGETAGQSQGRG